MPRRKNPFSKLVDRQEQLVRCDLVGVLIELCGPSVGFFKYRHDGWSSSSHNVALRVAEGGKRNDRS
jgi:hypothetical protein